MSDNQMKLLIIVLVLAIAGVGVGLYFTVTTNNKQYAQLQEDIAKKKAEEEEKHKKEQEIIIGITNTKLYNNVTKKIIDNNIYIEIEQDGEVIKKGKNGNKIYYSQNANTNLIIDGKSYNIDSAKRTVTIEYSLNNENFNINFIDTNIDKYKDLEIKQGREEFKEQVYNFEIINNIKYYFNGNELRYVIIKDKEIKINNISDAKENLFDIPQGYEVIDKTIEEPTVTE